MHCAWCRQRRLVALQWEKQGTLYIPLVGSWSSNRRCPSKLRSSRFVCLFFPSCATDWMGNIPSIPPGSALGCILRNWDKFDPERLKKKRLIFLCNTAWPQYKLGETEKWPENGSSNYNTILQLHPFCWRLGKWLELPYTQAFLVLTCAPSLCSGSKEMSALGWPKDILDDPF